MFDNEEQGSQGNKLKEKKQSNILFQTISYVICMIEIINLPELHSRTLTDKCNLVGSKFCNCTLLISLVLHVFLCLKTMP